MIVRFSGFLPHSERQKFDQLLNKNDPFRRQPHSVSVVFNFFSQFKVLIRVTYIDNFCFDKGLTLWNFKCEFGETPVRDSKSAKNKPIVDISEIPIQRRPKTAEKIKVILRFKIYFKDVLWGESVTNFRSIRFCFGHLHLLNKMLRSIIRLTVHTIKIVYRRGQRSIKSNLFSYFL